MTHASFQFLRLLSKLEGTNHKGGKVKNLFQSSIVRNTADKGQGVSGGVEWSLRT